MHPTLAQLSVRGRRDTAGIGQPHAVAKSFLGGVRGGRASPNYVFLPVVVRQSRTTYPREKCARVCDPRAPDFATAMAQPNSVLTSRTQRSIIHWLKRKAFRFTHTVDGHNQVETS